MDWHRHELEAAGDRTAKHRVDDSTAHKGCVTRNAKLQVLMYLYEVRLSQLHETSSTAT